MRPADDVVNTAGFKIGFVCVTTITRSININKIDRISKYPDRKKPLTMMEEQRSRERDRRYGIRPAE